MKPAPPVSVRPSDEFLLILHMMIDRLDNLQVTVVLAVEKYFGQIWAKFGYFTNQLYFFISNFYAKFGFWCFTE